MFLSYLRAYKLSAVDPVCHLQHFLCSLVKIFFLKQGQEYFMIDECRSQTLSRANCTKAIYRNEFALISHIKYPNSKQWCHKSLLYRVAVVKILTLKTCLSICSDFITSASCIPMHKNPQRHKIICGMCPIGCKDWLIDLNMFL